MKNETSFAPGRQKPEGSGRKPGTPNKKTQVLLDIFEAADYCPAVELLKILKGEASANGKVIVLEDSEIKDIHLKLMEFKFPKRKAVEHSGEVNTNMSVEQFIMQQSEKK